MKGNEETTLTVNLTGRVLRFEAWNDAMEIAEILAEFGGLPCTLTAMYGTRVKVEVQVSIGEDRELTYTRKGVPVTRLGTLPQQHH